MKSIHITQGRFNPVHAGHAMVVKHVMDSAKKEGADHKILTTGSHDAKKNPLTPEQKVKHLSRAVKGAHVEAMTKEHPTLLHQMTKLHKAGYTHVTMHVGSDRVNEFHKLLHQYNGKDLKHGHYNFKSIKVKSVGGERKEGGGGIESASGTAMRKHVTAGDKKSFHKMAPSGMSKAHKDELYHDVRKGMSLHETISFKQFLVLELAAIPKTPKPNRFHGNYGGKGNRGGEPVDKLDKEFQKHDVGYHHSKKPEDKIKHDKSLVKSTRKLVSDKSLPLKTRVKAGMAHALFRTKVALRSPKKK